MLGRLHALFLASLVILQLAAPSSVAAGTLPDDATLRAWLKEMKDSPRGPFERLRWFCKDGTVQPPRPYACSERGGGVQHGEWNAHALALRQGGYAIANVLAGIDPADFVGPSADLETLKQILLERFLISVDDGWIFRGARSYRGALQIEDEEAGARALVLAMLADPLWKRPERFRLLRDTVRSLPLQADPSSAADVRQRALMIAEKDADFADLRAKIHSFPDAGDAERVRTYARSRGKADLSDSYEQLAESIQRLYAPGRGAAALDGLASKVKDSELAASLQSGAERLRSAAGPTERIAVASGEMARLRDALPSIGSAETGLAALEASLALEREVYAASTSIGDLAPSLSRRARLELLARLTDALYGAGLLTRRHVDGVRNRIRRLEENPNLTVSDYRDGLRYLARAPEWASRWLEFLYSETIRKFAAIEPLAALYDQDQLRGSPLLAYSSLIDGLVLDANRLAGIEHEFFGETAGAGLRALNPGLARGPLSSMAAMEETDFNREGIYLLPETQSDLPPVAGILTEGEGSSLSHVQLLARNLGIPNVVVGDALLPRLKPHFGKRVVLAVSPNGVVQLAEDGPRWDKIFGREKVEESVVIRPDLKKLDLSRRTLIPLDELRAVDSGRTSGPKGAKLGELEHAFGAAVPNGFVIPFGVFRHLLDRPLEAGGPSVFEWMKDNYRQIEAVQDDPPRRQRMASLFLKRLRDWIQATPLDAEFRNEMRRMLDQTFGKDGTYGVFVRSDTNVEDLPGFTGAGLNLTIPNVVGFENILAAVREVWASPFTERAYGWRQAHMEQPEYVFPAVLIQLGFPAEKSGVMVTCDVDSGDLGWLSVAVNEGVGGAVEGQAAESLRIRIDTGTVEYLAQATAPHRAVLSPRGGVERLPASGTDSVLQPDEISRLISFAKEVPMRFPELRTKDGQPVPADVEFAFRGGDLALLQIRPFVESRNARRNEYLRQLDEGLLGRGKERVRLDAVPRGQAQ